MIHPKFLASVRSLDEARLAFEAGADLIDLKEPSAGALGAVPDVVVAEVCTWVAGRRLVSATIGDEPLVPERIAQLVTAKAEAGADLVKFGLFAGDLDATLDRLHPLTNQIKMVAVIAADRAPDVSALIPKLAKAGLHGAMMDTDDKSRGGLLAHQSLGQLADFVRLTKTHGLLCGLAGSLALDDIEQLSPLGADYLGFRGALCGQNRAGVLDPQRLRQVAARMATAAAVTAA